MVTPRTQALGSPRRKEMLVDPEWLCMDEGYLSQFALHEDEAFRQEPQDSALGRVLDSLLEGLPADERACVELRVFGQHSYREIARQQGWWVGDPPYLNGKRAWSAVRRGLGRLREQIGDRQWLESLAPRPEVLKEDE